MAVPKTLKGFWSSIGLDAILSSGRDVKVLLLLRMVRLFAFGGTTFILALYLSALGFSDSETGLFMTLTLVGDLIISMVLTYIGDRMGVRVTIVFGSVLMMASGVAFAFLDNYWLLLLASIVGVINPSANEVDPFKAIEESAIARLSTPDNCTDYFAWWSLLGMFGTAGSTLLTGFVVTQLQDFPGVTILDSYRAIFLAYAGIGGVKLLCCLCMTSKVELNTVSTRRGEEAASLADDQAPLLRDGCEDHYGTVEEPRSITGVVTKASETIAPMFTPDSMKFMWRLCLAMGLDFIGSGLAQISWMTYFFKLDYDISEGSLGSAVFVASLVSSSLNLVASPLSRTIGQVPTMVVCHTLNSISLLMISVPNNRTLALFLFMFRIVTREIDNAPRQAFISAGVLDRERTSAMGIINVVKTVSSGIGLFLTGEMAGMGHIAAAFILAGCLKLGYNVLITLFFWTRAGQKVEEDKEEEVEYDPTAVQ